MVWWIIFSVLLLAVAYILFAPFMLEIDTNHDLYRLRFHRIASASVAFHDLSVFLNLKITWWKKEIDLLETKPGQKEKVRKEKTPGKKKGFTMKKMLPKMKGIMQSFEISRCRIWMDTGDMPWNGILYPWLFLLSQYTGREIMINFWGRNELDLQIKNNAARILWAYLKS